MALPITGLTVPRQPDILNNIATSQQSLINPNISNDPDTIVGQWNQVISVQNARLAELLQQIYDSRNLDAATGKALDDLVSILDITRQGTFPTQGEQYFVGNNNNILIPANSQVNSLVTNQRYFLPTQVIITASNCRICVMSVTVVNSTTYTVTVEGTDYTFTSDADATEEEILNGLRDAINGASSPNFSAAVANSQLTVSTPNSTNLSISVGANISFDEITTAGQVEATVGGAVIQATNTVNTIVTPVGGWIRTFNPAQLSTGRNRETDAELRARVRLQLAATGLATPDAIISRLRNSQGVSFASVEERFVSQGDNSVTGQPAGSILTVVEGGTNQVVGQALWDAHGGGIETFGAITQAVVDINGDAKSVRFSRPTVIPSDGNGMYVNVTVTRYDEEVWPGDQAAITGIRAAVVEYGSTLGIGNDVLPQRFIGPIFDAISGVETVEVEVSTDGSTFTSDPVPIGSTEIATFSGTANPQRINVTISP